MALLLAMFQKMRLVREKNQLVLEQTQYSSKLSRIQKTIEKTQKRYTSLFQQLESQAKLAQSQATMMFQNAVGLGANSTGLYNYSGLNQFVLGTAASLTSKDVKNSNGEIALHALGEGVFQQMYQEYMQNGGRFTPQLDENGQQKYDKDNNNAPLYEHFNADQIKMFNAAIQQAQQQQAQAQQWVQNQNMAYQNNVSIWLEAQKSQLEAEQDAVLEPLNYEQTMLELEKDQRDMRLKRIEAEIQSYDQLVSQEAQNSAPKFGLG